MIEEHFACIEGFAHALHLQCYASDKFPITSQTTQMLQKKKKKVKRGKFQDDDNKCYNTITLLKMYNTLLQYELANVIA